jgi:gas vesicle protein
MKMAAQREMADLLENIRKELPERVHELYEEAIHRATEQRQKRGRHVARRMMRHSPWLRAERQRQQQQEGALAFFALIVGLIGGAALMYLFDPERGAQRRASLREQANRAAADFEKSVEETSQRAQNDFNRAVNQTRDAATEKSDQVPEAVKTMAQQAKENVSASALAARVRVEIARNTRQPAEIEVSIDKGVVTLTGKVLASEAQLLIGKARTARPTT